MYNFQKTLLRDWVYEGKRLTGNGVRTITKGEALLFLIDIAVTLSYGLIPFVRQQ